MPQLYTAGELATMIKMMGAMDVADLGDDESQNTYIFYFLNLAMMELSKLADVSVESDEVTLSADGLVTFTRSGEAILDLFEPKRIMYTENGVQKVLQKRTSDEAPYGWWRESQNREIHIRGFVAPGGGNKPLPATGYKLIYLKYPNKVTTTASTVEFAPSGYMTLVHRVLGMIKYAKNSYGGADFMDAKAKLGYNNATQAAISARGTGNSGQPLSIADAAQAKG